MTFEEFFIKKKIDLIRLRQVRPALYDEFESHFLLMGEKSFDHTKKYWFNNLRKDFLLKEQPAIPALKTHQPAVTANETAAEIPAVPAVKPPGFKPRFKSGITPAPNAAETSQPPVKVPEAETAPVPAAKPTGFKPRFKPGITSAKNTENPNPQEKKVAESENPDVKPTAEIPAQESPEPAVKPLGFKPRFKPGITNTKKDSPGTD